MGPAKWWNSVSGSQVQCGLCPHNCIINDGKTGKCKIRKNINGELISLVYRQPVAVHADPIEKKPLYHFLPGSRVFSIGTFGCNLDCDFCQNHSLSKDFEIRDNQNPVTAERIIEAALAQSCQSIAYTYNEPTIFGEYVLEVAQKAKEKGLKNVMVTNGFINPGPLTEIYAYIDAANVDLKAFSDEFYQKYCKGDLNAVLDAIRVIYEKTECLEITNLVVPGLNDSEQDIRNLAKWIVDNLSDDVPFHLSAFHPDFRMHNRQATLKPNLDKAYIIAKDAGLNYVYEGNVYPDDKSNTFCPDCGKLLIKRFGLSVSEIYLKNPKCGCGKEIPVIL